MKFNKQLLQNSLLVALFIFLASFKTFSAPIATDTVKAQYSHLGGFYQAPFLLTLSLAETSNTILYTLDGSNPVHSTSAKQGTSGLTIKIHPDSISGRSKTPCVIVRSAVKSATGVYSFPITQTYIFIDKVREQSYPGAPWPLNPVKKQVFDYEFAADVLNDARYKDSIEIALMALPSICIATDNDHLFSSQTGIYVNTGGRGIEWERDASVELLYPDATQGFNVNAGLRLRGGSSRSTKNPKHSLRLFFREDYGNGKLEFPLFGEEGADEFDKMDLRTAQNYSWNADEELNHLNTLVKDIFSRDLQREIGQPYSRGRYYHLYLNGMYWGIYQTDERPEAKFAETYLGGEAENYDVIKVSPVNYPYKMEVTDGTNKTWGEVYNLCNKGFKNTTDYFHLEGKNASGEYDAGKKKFVDIDNLIDYLLIIFYTGNFDAPTSSFGGNKMPNNFYAIYDHIENNNGFIFCIHDSEHAMMINPAYAGEGLYENRINIADRNGWLKMEMKSFEDFHPQWIHYRLSELPEYQQRFADRAYKVFGPEGLFTPTKAQALFDQRVKEIEVAIIAESARWGDARFSRSRTKHDDWLPQIDSIRDIFFKKRTDIVIAQMKEANLYTKMTPPQIQLDGQNFYQTISRFDETIALNIANTNGYGDLYYTLDGSDPRMVGGAISPNAIKASASSFNLNLANSAIINARTKNGNTWSAIRDLKILKNAENYDGLQITELNYHPMEEIINGDTTDGDNFEFIEFKNTGSTSLSLSGLRIDSAVNYQFPADEVLAPGAFFVVASKPNSFARRYGVEASGNYSKNLSNSGERFVLFDANDQAIMDFTYSDDLPWPEEADGDGYTLVHTDELPSSDPNEATYWRKSYQINGSPFADDVPGPLSNELEQAANFIIFPNPASNMITIDLSALHLAASENFEIEILDITGRLLASKTFKEKSTVKMDIHTLKSGMHYVRIKGEEISQTTKLVVE
jgi:hypothetical protein